MFEDAGWILCGRAASWYYFRSRKNSNASGDIFTDEDSRLAKYRRVLIFLAIVSLPIINQVLIYSNTYRLTDGSFGLFGRIILGISMAILVLLGYAVIRITMLMRSISRR
jgi:hypothetical protein